MKYSVIEKHPLTAGGYRLLTAMLVVRRLENRAARLAVFDDIKSRHKVIRLADAAYAAAGARIGRRILLLLYLIKSVLSLPAPKDRGGDAFALGGFHNEQRAIETVRRLLPRARFQLLQHGLQRPFGAVISVLRLLMLVPRIWRFLGQVARRYPFMPACRIASTFAYYLRFQHILAAAGPAPTLLIASNYSPETLGPAAATHMAGGRVFYVNHAPVPHKTDFIPPVLADVSFLYGPRLREVYAEHSRFHGRTVYIGQPGLYVPMVLPETLTTVGVFLTALTNLAGLSQLIAQIRQTYPEAQILIRHHPVGLVQSDLSAVTAQQPNITMTYGTPLADDIASCDLVVCGNSGVALNVLRAGRPVAFWRGLDDLPDDYNGFVVDRLVPVVQDFDAATLTRLAAFYRSENWSDVMRSYDATYGLSRSEATAQLRVTVAEVLAGTELLSQPVAQPVPEHPQHHQR